MASLLSAWVVLLALFSGSATMRGRGGETMHVGAIIGLYLLGGASAGALVGGTRRWMRWRPGAVAVGFLATLPFGAGLYAVRNNFAAWGRTEVIALLIFALAFGGGGGLILRDFIYTDGSND